MRSLSLRLLLLVCVVTVLRPDAAQARDFAGLTTRELAQALLVHIAPVTASTAGRSERQVQTGLMLPGKLVAAVQANAGSRPIVRRGDCFGAASGGLKYMDYRARSALSARIA